MDKKTIAGSILTMAIGANGCKVEDESKVSKVCYSIPGRGFETFYNKDQVTKYCDEIRNGVKDGINGLTCYIVVDKTSCNSSETTKVVKLENTCENENLESFLEFNVFRNKGVMPQKEFCTNDPKALYECYDSNLLDYCGC